MNQKYSKKHNAIILICIFSIVLSPMSVHANTQSCSPLDLDDPHSLGYINITVNEAWDLFNDTSNGIQIPIDVRYDSEWKEEHINTPAPEHARHHCKCEWADETILQAFMDEYEGKTIVLYCKIGGRSASAASTLVEHNFQGTIYNMIGGITYWKNNNLPTIPNRAPDQPTIDGPTMGPINTSLDFLIQSQDPDTDTLYYYVQWGDGSSEPYQTGYPSGEVVIFSHQWDLPGTYTITVRSRDKYFTESDPVEITITIVKTELEITQISGGLGAVSLTVENIGDYQATNVSIHIIITGGLLSNIDLEHLCQGCTHCSSSLDPSATKVESTREAGFLFGLGKINLDIKVDASNADQIHQTLEGLILGPLVVIR